MTPKNSPIQTPVFGIDAGSLNIHLVVTGTPGRDVCLSLPHKGDPAGTAARLMAEVSCCSMARGAVTGLHADPVAHTLGLPTVDRVKAALEGVRLCLVGSVDAVADLGGGSLTLIRLHSDGRFRDVQTNSLCAAGTGSFLDEQAARLGIDPANPPTLPPGARSPDVAARCAVFAKSDLIHRQQEGYTQAELWDGLAKGLARTIFETLFKGRRPPESLALIGGVARNSPVVDHLSALLGIMPTPLPEPQFVSARGCARLARAEAKPAHQSTTQRPHSLRPALKLKLSQPADFSCHFTASDGITELRQLVSSDLLSAEGWLGIDVGSTSTKLVFLSEDGTPQLDLYTRTAGKPLQAAQLLLEGLSKHLELLGLTLKVLGLGTTGSGRRLVGNVLSADCILNEISAHVQGAIAVDPNVETIFEIGGQDSKYMSITNGKVTDSHMNYVCAAGTGSFVEEVSRKLGVDVKSISREVLQAQGPVTSDRCTVFMENDAFNLLRQGYSRNEVVAAIHYSVAANYLHKVVGRRKVSSRSVVFQGATARNPALVAAFEHLLGLPIKVSPLCHVMGAFGVALRTRQTVLDRSDLATQPVPETSTFPGLEEALKPVEMTHSTCRICSNNCSIHSVRSTATRPASSWGYLCGREPGESVARDRGELALFRTRERVLSEFSPEPMEAAPTIWMPSGLLAHSWPVFWKTFFAQLGMHLEMTPRTSRQTVEAGSGFVPSDVCFPVKVALGHAKQLWTHSPGARLFAPYVISAAESPKTTRSFVCPYNVGLPGMLSAAMELQGIPKDWLVPATFDLRWTPTQAGRHLVRDLGVSLGANEKDMARAWQHAVAAQQAADAALVAQSADTLRTWSREGRDSVVLISRPYTLYDAGANLDIPAKLAGLGLAVVPMDCLDLDHEDIGEEFRNMFWGLGRRIVEASRLVARNPNLFAAFLTNFSCGPDSFIATYVHEIMGEKPMLGLELDEHGSDTGYVTRLEAFADVIRTPGQRTAARLTFDNGALRMSRVGHRTLWVPPMHEVSPSLASAVLRRSGFDARPLQPETFEAFEAGRQLVRGGECLPCPATLGSFVHQTAGQESSSGTQALFMPTACGPCRFGQYATLDRIILNRLGRKDVGLVSWNSTDSYDGLSVTARRRFWWAIVLGDLLFSARCRIAPYERRPGRTEEVYSHWSRRLTHALESGHDLKPLVQAMSAEFLSIERAGVPKPLVGIVGEIYVRQNRFCNQDLVRRIEAAGGEAWLSPISEWILYTAHMERWLLKQNSGGFLDRLQAWLKSGFLHYDEHRIRNWASPLLDDRREPDLTHMLEDGKRWFPMEFEGEAILTAGRAAQFARHGASMVINAAPFGCMPGSLTAAVLRAQEAQFGIPMITLFYDGQGDVNTRVDTFLHNLLPTKAEPEARIPVSTAATMGLV